MQNHFSLEDYRSWVAKYDSMVPGEEDLIRESLDALTEQPEFLIVTFPAKATDREHAYSSDLKFSAQSYGNFTCASLAPRSRPSDLVRLVGSSVSDFVVLLPNDALLATQALAEFVFAINRHPRGLVFFADQDSIRDGSRCDPVFKTSFDPILALGLDSIGIPVALRRSTMLELASRLVDQSVIGVENLVYEITLLLVAGGLDPEICHIPAVLAHRMAHGDWSPDDARKALERHVASDQVRVEPCRDHPQWSRTRSVDRSRLQKVSCIIPTRDQPVHLKRILKGLLQDTAYEDLQVVILDNDTVDVEALAVLADAAKDPRVEVVQDRRKFNYSRLNNLGAAQARGEIFVLLNNDMEVVDKDWLRVLVGYAARPDIGAVGAKLLYSNGTVQHAGIVFGPDYEIEHKHRFERGRGPLVTADVALSRCVSAVTGACLALRVDVFSAIGGLDEQCFPVAYNDVDLCRRIAARGLKIVYAADVELIHHESISRGSGPTIESQAREHIEELAFWRKHAADYERPDLYCSPNIVYELGRTALSCPPRRARPWAAPRETMTTCFIY